MLQIYVHNYTSNARLLANASIDVKQKQLKPRIILINCPPKMINDNEKFSARATALPALNKYSNCVADYQRNARKSR